MNASRLMKFLLTLLCALCGSNQAAERPNITVSYTDDHGHADLGHTPSLPVSEPPPGLLRPGACKSNFLAEKMPFVQNGLNSKPTFDQFGGVYYLGWQEFTRIQECKRSVFNVDISRDGKTWERTYRFETPESFQYPTFHEHHGVIWLSVSRSDHGGSMDRILFGRLEDVGQFASQAGQKRAGWPTRPPMIKK